jgi:hypothetical protein
MAVVALSEEPHLERGLLLIFLKTQKSLGNHCLSLKLRKTFRYDKSFITTEPLNMPLDLSLDNKMAGTLQEAASPIQVKAEDPIFALFFQNPSTVPKPRLMGLVAPDPSTPCPGGCVNVLGVAQYRIENNLLVCHKLVSYGYGPLMVLGLAKLAHDQGLTLFAEGPFSTEALDLLNRFIKEPVAHLTVQVHSQNSFLISYIPNAEVDVAFAEATKRLDEHIDRPVKRVEHRKWHDKSDLLVILRKDHIYKAAEAHHR